MSTIHFSPEAMARKAAKAERDRLASLTKPAKSLHLTDFACIVLAVAGVAAGVTAVLIYFNPLA